MPLRLTFGLLAATWVFLRFSFAEETKNADQSYEIKPLRGEPVIHVSDHDERHIVEIRSLRGIGKFVLTRRDDVWKKAIRFRLILSGLEYVKLVAGEATLEVSFSSSDPSRSARVWMNRDESIMLDNRNSLWPNPSRQLNPEKSTSENIPPKFAFELDLPNDLRKQNPKSIEIEWIDFYR